MNTGRGNWRIRAAVRRDNLALCLVLILGLAAGSAAAGPAGSLTANTVWDASGSPYTVDQDLVIPPGVQLAIRPGVRVQMGAGASLIIQGDLLAAGTADAPVVFTSAQPSPAPGDWGNLRFVTADTTLSYDAAGRFLKGSRMEHCVVEYGGAPVRGTSKEFQGGAIHCRKSSPYLKNLTIRYNKGAFGGGLYCHEFAAPFIEDCLFLENEARQSGGGLACFFYSNAIVKHCVFQANRAGEHGGGIYFSFSSPQILDNVIENNSARYQGGGLYGSNTVTQATSRVRGNSLLSNQAGEGGGNIYITAKIETIFQENCLFSGSQFDVWVDALEADLDFRGNYFGPLASGELEARTHDRYDDPREKNLLCDPVLDSPPAGAPNAPGEVTAFLLAGDPQYATDWPYPLCEKAPLYLEVRAADRNPYHPDWVAVRLRSSDSDPQGIVALAWETGPATGVFRLKGEVARYSSAADGAIRAGVGEMLFFSLEGVEGFEITRRVDLARSYITELRLPQESDSLHVVNHQPRLGWKFRNIFDAPQQRFQVQLAAGTHFAEPASWDSGERSDSATAVVIQGAGLQDGGLYSLRLRLNSGAEWSDWAEMPLRLNSLPTAPQPVSPPADQVANQPRPVLELTASTDAEGDPVTYEFQLYQDAAFTRVLAIEKEARAAGSTARWVPPVDLQDDAEYYWRARSRDAWETGEWTAVGHFWVNLVEEPPLPFALVDPEPGQQVYQLQSVFSWNRTVDPDPLSRVRYRLLISPEEKFPPASTLVMETEQTFLKADRPLANDASFVWKVEAVDNTGRFTVCDQVGRFRVSTTPSVPLLDGPLAGDELKPEGSLAWKPSTDPDPEDTVRYRLQVSDRDFAKPALEAVIETAGSPLSALEGLAALADDREYLFRVRAEDNHGIASAWSSSGRFFCNKVNTPPAPVTGNLEPDGLTVITPQPVIAWGPASDADRSDPVSSLSYLIQFDPEGAFGPGSRQVQVMAGVTRIAVPGLADNTRWHYRVCARDDEGALSPWSPPRSFILNTANDPPEPFALAAPQDGLETHHLTGVELSWQEARDVDPGDKLRYQVFLAAGDGPPAPLGLPVEGTSVKIASPLKNETEYRWWVEAVDAAGARTASADRFRLNVNTTPTVPLPQEVPDGVWRGKEPLRWHPSTDPDPEDVLTYEFQLLSPDQPEAARLNLPKVTAAKAAAGLGLADLKGVKALADNQEYAFRVRAVDPHGAVSAWSQPQAFVLDLVPQPPTPPRPQSPQAGAELPAGGPVELAWSAASDPDFQARLAYEVAWWPQDLPAQTKSLTGIMETSVTLADLEPGCAYQWRVTAVDETGLKSMSDTWTFTLAAPASLPQP
ncbi:MAG: hypothetical protein C4524_04790 [Candidatus Zixiibacteriota bacterium]|nr:MAG: hypothetical protein C4524_04790 [candidate division Zixibacteria bacterium]